MTEPQAVITDRASDLALASTELAAELAIRQAKQAADLAYDQGKRDAEVDGRLDGHEKRLESINGSMGRQATAVEGLGAKFDVLSGSFREHIAVENALASALQHATARGISARAHYISLGIFLVALIALILGVPHA